MTLKTYNGIAVASIKTYQGIAKASVKTVNGDALPVTDPYWSSVVLLAVNDNAANGSTTFIDQSPAAHTLTAGGNAQYSTARAPTGMTSSALSDGTDDVVSAPDSANWDLSGGDWTIEFMLYKNGAGLATWLSQSNVSADGGFIVGDFDNVGQLNFQRNGGAAAMNFTWSHTTGQWYHVALCRDGTTTYGYADGVTIGNSTNNPPAQDVAFSLRFLKAGQAGFTLDGNMSNIRITKGVARYPGGTTFTPPTLPMPAG